MAACLKKKILSTTGGDINVEIYWWAQILQWEVIKFAHGNLLSSKMWMYQTDTKNSTLLSAILKMQILTSKVWKYVLLKSIIKHFDC